MLLAILEFISSLFSRPEPRPKTKPAEPEPVKTEIKPMSGITMDELLNHKYKLADQSPEIQANLKELLEKVNKVRALWGKPMTVTSGLRTMQDHLRIYAAKGITDQSKIPMKSKHLVGQSCDFSDKDGKLAEWTKNNLHEMESIGLWMEDFAHTKGWVHFQTVAPKSGARTFLP